MFLVIQGNILIRKVPKDTYLPKAQSVGTLSTHLEPGFFITLPYRIFPARVVILPSQAPGNSQPPDSIKDFPKEHPRRSYFRPLEHNIP